MPSDRLKCRKGHVLTPGNVVRDGVKQRCRTCRQRSQAAARKRASQKAALARKAREGSLRQAMRNAKKDGRERSRGRTVSVEASVEAYGDLMEARKVERGKPLGKAALKQRIDDLIRDTMAALTPEKISLATAKDLATMAGILIDKRQVMANEPTAIVRHDVRVKLDALGPLLLEEMRRRGLPVIDLEVQEA